MNFTPATLNLSKLSRGHGERKGSIIQVIYDDQVYK